MIDSKLDEAIRRALKSAESGDQDGMYSILCECVIDFGPDKTGEACRRADPDRRFLDSPLALGETGLHGAPLAETRYRICSNRYGDLGYGYRGSEEFLDACSKGYQDGTLHDAGHIVVDLRNDVPAFLVTHHLERDVVPVEEDVTFSQPPKGGGLLS